MTAPLTDVNNKPRAPLPRSLRADIIVRTPLSCRFGWHHFHWERHETRNWKSVGTCARCGMLKEKWL